MARADNASTLLEEACAPDRGSEVREDVCPHASVQLALLRQLHVERRDLELRAWVAAPPELGSKPRE